MYEATCETLVEYAEDQGFLLEPEFMILLRDKPDIEHLSEVELIEIIEECDKYSSLCEEELENRGYCINR